MINATDIQASMVNTLKRVFKIKTHREHISKLSVPAFHIKLVATENRLVGRKQVERDILIDITYYAANPSVMESMTVREKLECIFYPYFKVDTRFLAPEQVETKYVDEDLHFIINFKYYDTVEHLYVYGDDVITDKENEDKEVEHQDGTTETVPMSKMTELYLELEAD